MSLKPNNSGNKPFLSATTPVSALRGVGAKRAAAFGSAGIFTVEDLLYHFPYRYEDRRQRVPLGSLKPGQEALAGGTVIDVDLSTSRRRRGFSIFKATIKDESGLLVITWFNQPWMADKVKIDREIIVFGSVDPPQRLHALTMNSPQLLTGNSKGERGILPVYQRIKKITSPMIRVLIETIFENYSLALSLTLPESIRVSEKLMPLEQALRYIHTPPKNCDLEQLQQRRDLAHGSLIFAEFFAVQAGLALLKKDTRINEDGIIHQTSPEIRETLKKMLPFTLTGGQRQAFKEIVNDMTSPGPMRRLLQGDVGSGKTIVALLAAALAIENGYQAVFMAPTEILAEQHIQSIRQHCTATGFRTAFLTGSLSSGERRKAQQQIANGEADLIVGTHALIQKGVNFKRLGLAIVDEQHRFGVMQRAALLERAAGLTPDLLIMTATPIPRSLTLTLFGDLSVSQIIEKPPGRQPVTTAVRSEKDKPRIIAFLKKETGAGRQVYWVCPRIEDNPEDDIRSAEQVYDELKPIFGDRHLGLIHGRINTAEREQVMGDFITGKVRILVATTVIEVGVDVPNATVMLIENAERFGLSQLHQLRGRVGRGKHKSYCILLHSGYKSEDAAERLSIMTESEDGFIIAEKDLEIRGPGDFLGTRQSGVPTFRIGSLIRDAKLLEEARTAAFKYISDQGDTLKQERSEYIRHLRHQWQQKYGLVLVG